MDDASEPFGARLYAELRKVAGCHSYLGGLNYEAIGRLKQADREATAKMFYGSSYDFIQQLKAKEPAEMATYLAEQIAKDAAAAAAIFFSAS